MGIFDRLGSLVKSNVNDMISKAEDPEKMLNQMILDMNKQYNDAKGAVATAIAEEKKLKRRYEEQQAQADHWVKKAELAVEKGDDELALAALGRKQEYAELAEQYKVEWTQQKQSTDMLKKDLKGLSTKIEEAKRKRGLLIARAKRAEAQQSIQNTMSGINDTSAFDTFDRMSEKVESAENMAAATAELNASMSDDLDSRFDALEKEDNSAADELAALKAKLGK